MAALAPNDPRLPAVRARCFLLVRALWKAGVMRLPMSLESSDAASLRYLAPLWRRLRVEVLGATLVETLIPRIERHLASAGVLRREADALPPRAPVDWPATWRAGRGRPLTDAPLVVRRWERDVALPETLLAHRALREVAADAALAVPQAMSAEEGAPLRALLAHAEAALHRPPWLRLPTRDDAALITEATTRIEQIQQPDYLALLGWWRQWAAWGQPTEGQQPLLDPALEGDALFELLFLLELVQALAQRFPVRQLRPLGGEAGHPTFIAETAHGPLALFFQSGRPLAGQRALTALSGIPDLLLRLPGEPPRYAILDAKNYGPRGHSQAIYKMLGYLYQYGYDATGAHRFGEVLAGVLAFPTEEREGTGLRNWQREHPGAQAIFSFVLPPLPDERYTGMGALVTWLMGQIADVKSDESEG